MHTRATSDRITRRSQVQILPATGKAPEMGLFSFHDGNRRAKTLPNFCLRDDVVSPGTSTSCSQRSPRSPAFHTKRLAADAPWAEGAGVDADLLKGAGERPDVGVGEVAGEVLFDRVPVAAAGLHQHVAALFGEDDED